MKYEDYLKAAKRHRETCDYLLKRVSDPQDFIDVPLKGKLLQNIYYLSGYVIECIISHSFFNVIDYDKSRSVYELDRNNPYNYTFHKYFKEHSNIANQLRIDEIRKRGGNLTTNIPIIGDVNVEDAIKSMYEEWDAKSRYSSAHLSFEINQVNVINFYKLANDIYINMRKI